MALPITVMGSELVLYFVNKESMLGTQEGCETMVISN